MTSKKTKLNPSKASFLLSLPRWRPGAVPDLPMVMFAGRSNVGKSSFINMLLRRKKLARTSVTPGRTQLLNFFDVDARLVLVDVPGYGYAKAPPAEVRKWTENVRDFVQKAESLSLVVQLLDIRRDPSAEDLAFADLVRSTGRPLLFAVTKADKEARGKRAARLALIGSAMGAGREELIATSAEEGTGRDLVWGRILEHTGIAGGRGSEEDGLGEGEARLAVVAIDGPAGAGKSTVAKAVAKALGWGYLDTGAMYRAIGLKADRLGIALDDDTALSRMCRETVLEMERSGEGDLRILLDGEDVSRAIRENRVSDLASRVSARKPVREAMSGFQRRVGAAGPTVAEGRDMGTVVFPDALVKVFLTADPEKRADRRVRDLEAMGQEANREKILAEIIARDASDSSREHAPLKPASDSVLVDTSIMTVDEVVHLIRGLAILAQDRTA